MTAVIINFPTPAQVDAGDDGLERDCRECVHARFGRLTHCVLVGEDIAQEAVVAKECEAFERD